LYGWEQGVEEQRTISPAQKQGIVDVESVAQETFSFTVSILSNRWGLTHPLLFFQSEFSPGSVSKPFSLYQ